MVVVAGSGLLLRTFNCLNAVLPGFDRRTSIFDFFPARYEKMAASRFAQLIERVAAINSTGSG